MSDTSDFIVVDVPAMLAQQVTISDGAGSRPDPDWNREAAESQSIFADFLAEKRLLADGVVVTRTPSLVVRWSELNEQGKRFVRQDFDRWLVSVDKVGTTGSQKMAKLERRWTKFVQAQAK